jgi:hypothetical protein
MAQVLERIQVMREVMMTLVTVETGLMMGMGRIMRKMAVLSKQIRNMFSEVVESMVPLNFCTIPEVRKYFILNGLLQTATMHILVHPLLPLLTRFSKSRRHEVFIITLTMQVFKV